MTTPRNSPSGKRPTITTDDISNLSSAEGEPLTTALNNLVDAQQLAQEVFPFGVNNGQVAFGSAEGVFRSLGFLTTGQILAANVMACNLDVAGTGTLNMGLYDEDNQLIAESISGFKAPIAGLNIFPFLPVDLDPLMAYYIGITSRLTGAQFTGYTGGIAGIPTPRRFIEEATGNAGPSMRASFDPTNAAQTDRAWAIVGHL